jgi:hypothetical protein
VVTVSFVEDTVTVAEGETAEIGIRYQVASLASPLRLMVSPLDRNTLPADYELSASGIEIPAGRGTSGTRALSLSALADDDIAEGNEALSLRLVFPAGTQAQLGRDLAVTIADAGGAPCTGIRVRATPITPLGAVPRWVTTSLTVSQDTDAGSVWFEWEGPYLHGEECVDDDCREWWESRSPELEVNLVEWRIESSVSSTDHVLEIDWRRDKTAGLRFHSPEGNCAGEPAVACTETGCELTR